WQLSAERQAHAYNNLAPEKKILLATFGRKDVTCQGSIQQIINSKIRMNWKKQFCLTGAC
ncbi:MAG: hypothetical protein Q7I89_01295, partial [Syntrophales bacterium]|nr:hypothetical protein [Syntrophales bacterium]